MLDWAAGAAARAGQGRPPAHPPNPPPSPPRRSLGLAARHLDDNAATQVASGLATMLAGGDEGARDVAAIAAKAAAADAGGPMAHALVARLVPAMLDVLKKEVWRSGRV